MFKITDKDLMAINRYQAFSTGNYIKTEKYLENVNEYLDKPSVLLENYGTENKLNTR